MFYQFPNDFAWGSAVWAQGVEGAWRDDGKAKTVFEHDYEMNPERFYNQTGPDETLDWYHRYPEYIEIAEKLNHNSFRTSISWARLLPDGENLNLEALAYYKEMFTKFQNKGIKVFVVLYWFDMPYLFEKQGGFGNREILPKFLHYCNTCFECFDGLVNIWYVYNEPSMDSSFKYLNGFCWPRLHDFGYERQAAYNMVVAHAQAVKAFREGKYHGKIGTVINDTAMYPRSEEQKDVEAVWYCDTQYITSFMDPLIKGRFPEAYFEKMKELGVEIEKEPGDEVLIRENTMDVLGINYYSPDRLQAVDKEDPEKAKWEQLYTNYEKPGRRMNLSRGWEIYPEALYDVLMRIKNEYDNIPVYICENGMGIQGESKYRDKNGIIADDYRIEFIKEHLRWAFKAINDGVQLKGYHVWSFIDLWSPTNAFKNLYGLVEFDLKTGNTRIKKSGHWYAEVIRQGGITWEEKEEEK